MKKPHSAYWQLLPYLQPQWPIFLRGLVCVVGYGVVTLCLPYLGGEVAVTLGEGKVSAVSHWLGLATLVFLVRAACLGGQDMWMAQASLQVAFQLRRHVYSHLHQMSLAFFERSRTGDLAYRLTEDVDRVGEVVNKIAHQFIPCLLQLVAIPIYMFYLNWQLTLATLCLAPLLGWLISWFGQKLLLLSRRSQQRVSDLSALVTEVFAGVQLVQAFAAADHEIKRFTEAAQLNRHAQLQSERLKAVQFPVVGFLQAMSILLLLLLGGWEISRGTLTSRGFVSYLTAIALLIEPIALFTSSYNDFKQGEASVERVFELLAIQPQVGDAPQAIQLTHVQGKVEYRQVSFAYQSGQKVLDQVSLVALPGEVVALVGASGAGKSTLVNLLPRFYDPQAGQILIDGSDICTFSLASLRGHIGIVPQETILFSGTIAANIAFGRAEFSLAAVREAAQIANADSFISRFPQGYHTWMGERGVTLSGGQRQRLAIARAVLLDPPILILDEATSALDSESEALVQEAIERLMVHRTVFIIAHRLSTVRRASQILVLEQGRIVEAGTHNQLLEQSGRYAQFYAQQFA